MNSSLSPGAATNGMPPRRRFLPLSRTGLDALFRLKYSRAGPKDWGPRTRYAFGYFNPDDHYEALISKLVRPDTRWLDVGCGRELFPSNRVLAAELSARCGFLLGVDPDDTLDQNPFVHARAKVPIDEFTTDRPFDLVTLRMVAEHIAHPERALAALAAATAPGGLLVVYTVNRFSPVPLLTSAVPFALHHPVKRLLWRTEREDTFPTCFRMNTRTSLRRLAEAAGFQELEFAYLDDCRTFGRFRPLLTLELSLWRLLRALGLRYPENCLLGIYLRG
jgi:SAM-dependent methyltransferase